MKKKHSVRFDSHRNAESFAKRTGGKLIDLREDPVAKSKFKVKIDRSSSESDNNYVTDLKETEINGDYEHQLKFYKWLSNPGNDNDYCKDWKEAEMNGEFAYDGATDDF